MNELEACVRLQFETWGYGPNEAVPRKSFLLAQQIGGQVIGAFASDAQDEAKAGRDDALVGFALSLPGVKTTPLGPAPYLHSHMLAVRAAYRNRGLGAQLKWEQRREALSRGIRRMEWTFDPLEIKNAFLNLHKLGAVARSYRANFYGVSSSHLQGGLPTDRLLAEWELDSPRVAARLARRSSAAPTIEERIVVPASISAWKSSDATRERALDAQRMIRKQLEEAFSRGWAVLGFSLDPEGNGIYELGVLNPTENCDEENAP